MMQMLKKIYIILLFAVSLQAANLFKQPFWTHQDTVKIDSSLKFMAARINDIRHRAGYDSLEQALVDSDSTVGDTVTIASGWLKMQPNHIDTLLNKATILGESNMVIQAPNSYALRHTVGDTAGFDGRYGGFYWEDKENIHINGGKYIHDTDLNVPGNHLMYFNGCSKIYLNDF